MSGRKYSEFTLEREREQRMRLVAAVGDGQGRCRGLTAQIQRTLDLATEGLKTTFEAEVQQASAWLREANRQTKAHWPSEPGNEALTARLGTLNGLSRRGERVLRALTMSFTQKAGEMEAALVDTLSQLQGLHQGYSEGIAAWLGDAATAELERSLGSAEDLLRRQTLKGAEDTLAHLEGTFRSRIAEMQELEHKHQKRLYVLKALRQVCVEMGFKDTEPQYVDGAKRGRIVYEVDTYSQGTVAFYLTLEGVTVDSCIADDMCLDEFDKLSTLLQEEFGVKTEFRPEDGRPDSRLIQRGEMDLPDGASIERAGG